VTGRVVIYILQILLVLLLYILHKKDTSDAILSFFVVKKTNASHWLTVHDTSRPFGPIYVEDVQTGTNKYSFIL